MPSVEPLNAAKRVSSSDLDNSFFRAWALRGSEGSNSTESYLAASSTSQSPPPISPYTQVPDRKNRGIDRRKFLSESNTTLAIPALRGPVSPCLEPSSSTPIIFHEEPPLPPYTTASSNSESSKKVPSSRSSESIYTRRASGRRRLGLAPKSDEVAQPSSEIRKRYKWKHQTSGHWFEFQFGRKKTSEPSQVDVDNLKAPAEFCVAELPIEDNDKHGPAQTRSSLLSLSKPPTNTGIELSISPDPRLQAGSAGHLLPLQEPKEGLYRRTKRALGLKHEPVTAPGDRKEVPEESMNGEVGETLDKVSSALRHLVTMGHGATYLITNASNLSIAAPSAIERWQRLQPGSASSSRSSSSSLLSLVKSRLQPPTPEPWNMYTGSDKKNYLSVELTDADVPSFLPSEAQRVRTPAMDFSTSGIKKRLGYFIVVDNDQPPSPMSPGTTLTSLKRGDRPSVGSTCTSPNPAKDAHIPMNSYNAISGVEWYMANSSPSEAGDRMTREQFVLSVPEHLPNSPMCPKHPKNKSKGKGVCVYHGRKLSISSPSPFVGLNGHLDIDTGSGRM